MRIAIDASSANKQTRTGVEWYAFHVIEKMKRIALQEDESVTLYTNEPLRNSLNELPDGWQESVLEWSLPFGWMRGRMSWEMITNKPDVLFVPAQGLPHFTPNNTDKGQATITTVHDVGFKRYPGLYDRSARRRLESVTRRAVKHATYLLTVSEFSKQELIDLYGVEPDRISVTPLAADPDIFYPKSNDAIGAVLDKYRISGNYFLFVGRLEKKKNISALIRAFELFKHNRGPDDNTQLVLAGTPGFGFDEIKEVYENVSVKEAVHMPGYLPTKDIAALMSGAVAYLFPSKYEGFGLPNLEAMACRTPLITSDIPPHREVVGEAGLFVSPTDDTAWAMAMQRIIEESGLAIGLAKKGLERAERFSWQKVSEQTFSVLRNSV